MLIVVPSCSLPELQLASGAGKGLIGDKLASSVNQMRDAQMYALLQSMNDSSILRPCGLSG
jgi:hypothetical protein